jgi:glycosyltransferase involved in cell wall biosynthesis
MITDAWGPQINGVVTTLTNLVKQADADGWTVLVIHPGLFPSCAAPGYPEIRLSWPSGLWKMVKDFQPDHLHIATEGPLGLAARLMFRRRTHTTAYHTQWAPFLQDIAHIPPCLTWQFLKWFHSGGAVMVPTPRIRDELISRRVGDDVALFSRGVDLEDLRPTVIHGPNTKPRLLSVGRVSKEKNLDVFCQLDHERYDLVMVGDGPYLAELRYKYPHVQYLGMMRGGSLANQYVLADCMVFTSCKDTFGLVIIESQMLGTPVAAYPVHGPVDVILPETGVMSDDINLAIEQALELDRDACMARSRSIYSWASAWQQFRDNLVEHDEED